MTAYVAARSNLGVYLAGEKPTPQTEHIAAVEQAADAKLDTALGALQSTITSRLMATAGRAKAAANAARVGLLWCLVIGVIFALAVTTSMARKALRVEHEWTRRDAVQLDLTRRTEFEARLQRALEMAKAEVPVFDLVAEALGVAAPDLCWGAAPRRFEPGPFPASPRQSFRRPRYGLRRGVARGLSRRRSWAVLGLSLEYRPRRVPQPTGSGMFGLVRSREHQR